MNCGAAMAMQASPDSLRATKLKYAIGITLVLLILFAAVGTPRILSAFGRSGGGKTLVAEGASSGNSLKAEGSAGSGVLQAEGSAGSGILQAKGNSSPAALKADGSHAVMPDDVRKWLEHLERIEKKRGQLSTEQLSGAIVTMTELQLGGGLDAINSMINDSGEGSAPESPASSTKKEFENYQTEWTKLNEDFWSLPPPAECIPTRDAYNMALNETGTMIVEIVKQIETGMDEPKKAIAILTGMKGTSEARIGKPSRTTDDLVAGICNKYDTRKWFSISTDFGSGLFGKLGL